MGIAYGRRMALLSLLSVVGGSVLIAVARAEDSPKLPRYRLEVGQELKFEGSSIFRYEGGAHGTREKWTAWVIRQNADGGWRLVLRKAFEFGSAREARKPVAETSILEKLSNLFEKAADPANENEDGLLFAGDPDISVAWCDLTPDGRLTLDSAFQFRMSPSALFPRLPETTAEATSGWSTHDDVMDETTKAAPKSTDKEGVFLFELTRESPMNVIYGSESTGTVTFNLERGLPEQTESVNTQTYGFNGKGTGSLKLVDVTTHPQEWRDQFVADTDRYFAALKAYDDVADSESKPASEIKGACEAALTDLKAAVATIESAELKSLLEKQISREEQIVSYRVESAEKKEALLGKPSAEWTTTDLAGTAAALTDYRGKVVVLDFWYRGCGWCIRAMPQMKQVTDDLKDRPVVVLGMNTDQKAEDAQFVIDAMGLNYGTLKGEGIPEKYNINGFPTLVILDGEGVVRDVHVGYSPTLRRKVVESVEKILSNTGKEAASSSEQETK